MLKLLGGALRDTKVVKVSHSPLTRSVAARSRRGDRTHEAFWKAQRPPAALFSFGLSLLCARGTPSMTNAGLPLERAGENHTFAVHVPEGARVSRAHDQSSFTSTTEKIGTAAGCSDGSAGSFVRNSR